MNGERPPQERIGRPGHLDVDELPRARLPGYLRAQKHRANHPRADLDLPDYLTFIYAFHCHLWPRNSRANQVIFLFGEQHVKGFRDWGFGI